MIRRITAGCILLSSAMAGTASADSGPGCGLGQQVFSGQSGLSAHVLAATTNGSVSNQLFGISFDSLGCDGTSVITAQFQRDVFVAQNLDNLARDAAQGGGEHLQSLASLLTMTPDDADRFYAMAQRDYDDLFVAGDNSPEHWVHRLDVALAADAGLARYAMPQDNL